jgi:6-phosphogluconate dehydrogenase
MVHNAIEYGMMQSIAEGFSLLEQGRFSKELELSSIAHIWNNGTIISSFLMQMTERALREEDFSSLAACVDDSGEGRWAVHEAIDSGVPFQVNTAALYARKTSQGNADFANRLLSAIRNEFGGHPVKKDS